MGSEAVGEVLAQAARREGVRTATRTGHRRTERHADLGELGQPEAVFKSGAAPSTAGVIGMFMCGPILLAAVAVAVIFLGLEEGRQANLMLGILAVPVGVAALVGWVVLSKMAKADRQKLALLYPTGFALVNKGESSSYLWEHIEEVELRPDTRTTGPKSLMLGHKFTVKMSDGTRVVLGMEYFGVTELGLAIMERSATAGATCTGYATLPE